MRSVLVIAFIVCLAAAPAFSQDSLSGKWATVRPADPLAKWENMQLELHVEGTTASGTLSIGGLGGTFYSLKDGKVTGKRVQFKTQPSPNSTMTFTIDVVDQNTVTIFQSLPDLALVGNNVLDLLRTLPGFQAAAQSPTQAVSASPTIARAPSSASISGIVHDESNAMIPGVTVSLTHLDTGQTLTVTSDETGRYEFSSIQGKYRLTASLPGFRTTTINDLSIGSSQSQQDVTLIVGFEPRILVVPTPDPPETRTIAVAPLPIIERDPQKGIATGIVRGPDGKPAARLRVAVVTPPETPGDRASTSLSVQTETDEQGRYVLQGIPRGRYMIAAGRVDNPTYFPGTLDMARATILSIEPGMFFTELNFSTTVRNERPLDASTNTTASRSDPGPGPCVPNTARCTLLHRVQ